MGGSGVGVLFNANDTILHVSTSTDSDAMILFDPVNMVCSATAITKDKNQTSPGSSSVHADFGGGFFSLTDPAVWYSFGGGMTDGYLGTQVVKYTFTSLASGTHTVGPIVADFQYGFSSTANTPAWANNTTYHFGDYVLVTLAEPDWQANKSDYLIGDIIVPAAGNPAGCAFKLQKIASGDAGKTIYVRGAGAGGKMLVSTIASYQSATQVTLSNAATTSVTGAQIEAGANLNYVKYGGGQGTGNWNVMYDASVNRYYLWNTATGINSQYTCSGESGPQCAGGAWVYAVRGKLADFAGGTCAMNIHNLKLATVCHHSVVTEQGSDLIMGASACPHFSGWNADDATFNSSLDVQDVGSLNHWTVRGCDVVGLNNSGYGASSGVYMATHDLRNPGATPQIIWEVSPCSISPDANGNYIPSACDLGQVIDNHLSGVYNPTGSDDKPICGDTYNYDTALPIANTAYQGEVTCTQSAARWTNTASPQTTVWRGPHTFNTQTNDLFSARFVLSQYSQTGKFLAFTSDWNNTLGSTDGTTPTLGTSPAGSIARARIATAGGTGNRTTPTRWVR